MVTIRREVYVNSEVTGTTKVIHVPAIGGMLYVDHIIIGYEPAGLTVHPPPE